MRSIREIPVFENIPILVRAALNVPVKDASVANPFRLTRAIPTIEYLQQRHARVVLCGHIGEAGTETLMPVFEAMKPLVKRLSFCSVSTGPDARAAVRALAPGDVLMLENLRRNPGETANDKAFAAELASLADVFVEDSFDVCHREHASVVGVPALLPSYAGLLVEEEVRELSKALKPVSPSLAIIGGAKFSTKEPVLRKLLSIYDHVYVGGALGNDFVKARGYGTGTSLVSDANVAQITDVLQNPRTVLATDAVVAPSGSKRDKGHVVPISAIPATEAVLDDGPASVEMLAGLASGAKTILWNGPLGNYENGFTDGTENLARAIAASAAHSVVGGGDTVAAIEKLGVGKQFSFISTGGGAMLDFLANGTLPGIEVLG